MNAGSLGYDRNAKRGIVDFEDLDALGRQLLAFGRRYEQIAAPFQWKFTRADLKRVMAKVDAVQPDAAPLAA